MVEHSVVRGIGRPLVCPAALTGLSSAFEAANLHSSCKARAILVLCVVKISKEIHKDDGSGYRGSHDNLEGKRN